MAYTSAMTSAPTASPILWYFADPMCSWCWGFSPVIETLREAYRERLKIALMLGGLRPGTREPMTAQQREEILHHWRDVQVMTGQAFSFEGALPAGFVYDTEPASRAVITAGAIDPAATFPYFKSVQQAFYVEQRDVTRPDELAALAQDQGMEAEDFLARFESEEMKRRTQQHFLHTRQAGVKGFPALIASDASGPTRLSEGCRSFEEVRSALDAWLAARGRT
jgi:putative protein-disulfide isomerase